MNFSEFLKANGLPSVGSRVATPSGEVLEVLRYEFDNNGQYAVVSHSDDCEIYWTFDQIRKCSTVSEKEFYSDLLMEQQEQM